MVALGKDANIHKILWSQMVLVDFFVGWGMSIDSKRAKERQKRTQNELVMVKTVKREKLKSQGPDIWGSGRISGA